MSSHIDSYSISRDATEASRLDIQHRCYISCQGYYVHPDIRVPSSNAWIADFCTGTAIWIREVAALNPDAECHGFDISDKMFPLEKLANVQLHIADITKPIESRWLGYFDVVHIRLLQAALTKAQWAPTVRNVVTMLKPGGWLQWVEDDRPIAVRRPFRAAAPEGVAERSLAEAQWKPPRFTHISKYLRYIMDEEKVEAMNYGYMNLDMLMADSQAGNLEEVRTDAFFIDRQDDGGKMQDVWSRMGLSAARSMFKYKKLVENGIMTEGYDEYADLCVEDLEKGAEYYSRATVFIGRRRL